jgi:hypothetical protein
LTVAASNWWTALCQRSPTIRRTNLPLDEAVALVEPVRLSAERHAKLALDAIAKTVPRRILGVALRQCPVLPPTIAGLPAQNVAHLTEYPLESRQAENARLKVSDFCCC